MREKSRKMIINVSVASILLIIFLITPVVADVPAPPVPLLPGNPIEPGFTIPLTPTLMWTSVVSADYYALAISKYPYGSSNIIYNPQSDLRHFDPGSPQHISLWREISVESASPQQ